MELIRGRQHTIYFDSMIELMDLMDQKIDTINAKRFEEYKRRFETTKFGPTVNTPKQAIEKSIIGDNVLYEKYVLPRAERFSQTVINQHEQTISVVKRRKVKKSFGDELDIHMVNQGKLDRAWTTTERIEVDQKHHLVTVLVHIGGNWNVEVIDSLWTTALCLKVIDDLQKAGKSVKVIVGGYASGATICGNSVDFTCCVKRYDEHLSIERLAAMCNLGFYRSVGFIAKMLCSKRLEDNLGFSQKFTKHNLPINVQDEIAGGFTKCVVINSCVNEQQAINELNAVNKQLSSNDPTAFL